MARNVLGIVFYCLGGFFLSIVNSIGFFSTDQYSFSLGEKLWIMGVMLVPALIFIGLGLVLRKISKWRHDIGVILLSVSAYQLFMVSTLALVFSSQEIKRVFPQQKEFYFFNDYLTGIICLLLFVFGGFLCLYASKRKNRASYRKHYNLHTKAGRE
ncbi:MAG: hypothetical protein GF375_02045 [Candidatus Omnitrophica bacterium]|nr:hypothetical protein [Candidatus Omnitrophota bacterium]MBD3268896.1 hypothetical protein [Candidatus Omnitrophota bacterium]